MAAFSFLNPHSGAIRLFINRLSRSRFFTISVALHFVFVLTFGSVVLVKQATQKTEIIDNTDEGKLVAEAPAVAPEPVEPIQPPSDVAPETTVAPASLSAITSSAATSTAFALPATASLDIVPTVSRTFSNNPGGLTSAPAPTAPGAIPRAIAQKMVDFQKGWTKPDQVGSGVSKSRSFKFTAFLAKYAGGDWDSTVQMNNGKIFRGSLPNLLYIMRKWSHDKIDAQPDAVPLDIASDDLFTKKPPFVLFTGHQDFVLTDKEVENLQKYLQLGGCVWGDSSLPGNRSRFDLAFRREMKRVLPDQDINWQTLPPEHDLFVKKYYTEVVGVPPGLNYYQEPIYVLKNFNQIVVLYTANDYCDMWQIGLDEKGLYDLRKDEGGSYVATNGTLYDKRGIYFRDLEAPRPANVAANTPFPGQEKPVVDSYKFGTNIVIHLLTRWEDQLRNVPTGSL